MSMNPDTKDSGCCGGAKPVPQNVQQPAAQATAPDAKARESIIPPPSKPTTPQPKSKSCCG